MVSQKTPIRVARCALSGEEYICAKPGSINVKQLNALDTNLLETVISLTMDEPDSTIMPHEKGEPTQNNTVLLERQKHEKRNWKLSSWSIIACLRDTKPIKVDELKELKRLFDEDGAEQLTAITTSSFTENALNFALENNFQLIHAEDFVNLVKNAAAAGKFSKRSLKIPSNVRSHLLKLQKTLSSLSSSRNSQAGRWTSPLLLNNLIKELTISLSEAFEKAPDDKEKAQLEKKMLKLLGDVSKSFSDIEKQLSKLFEATATRF